MGGNQQCNMSTSLKLLLFTTVLVGASSLDCTWGKYKSNPYNITVVNNGPDKVKIRTCGAEVCSSGTHKYVDCPAYIEAGTTWCSSTERRTQIPNAGRQALETSPPLSLCLSIRLHVEVACAVVPAAMRTIQSRAARQTQRARGPTGVV